MPQKQNFSPNSFMRRQGVQGLRLYMENVGHPLLTQLTLDPEAENQLSDLMDAFHHLEDQAQKTQDFEAFRWVNELASSEAYPFLVKECQSKESTQSLINDYKTAEHLAMALYCYDPQAFKSCSTQFKIIQESGWLLFQGEGVSETHPWNDVQNAFEDAIRNDFQNLDKASGSQVVVEAYEDANKLMLHAWYEGNTRVVEELKDNKLIRQYYNPSKDTALIYNKKTGLLKVKTERYKERLSKALCNSFAHTILKNPSALLDAKKTRIVNLAELKSRSDFKVKGASCISYGIVTFLKFKETEQSKKTFQIQDNETIFETLIEHHYDLENAEIMQAKIRFYYTTEDKMAHTTVEFTESTNRVTTTSSVVGEAIDAVCQSWGLLGGKFN
jgi:hypothetical protein